MTPEATYSALHLLDRWRLMLLQMQGEAAPPLPEVQGRRHLMQWADGSDPVRQAWDAEHGLLDSDGSAAPD